MRGVLDDGLDEERRLGERLEVRDDLDAVRAAVELGQLVAVLGNGRPYPVCGRVGAGPQQDVSMGGGDGGEPGRDRARAGDGKLFWQGVSWVEGGRGTSVASPLGVAPKGTRPSPRRSAMRQLSCSVGRIRISLTDIRHGRVTM